MKSGREPSRKISDGNFTLGRVCNELSAAASATRMARKISLQESIHYANRHQEVISGTAEKATPADDLASQIKSMRRSLQAELKNKASSRKKSFRSNSRRMTTRDSEAATRIGWAATPVFTGTCDSVSRVSSAFSRDVVHLFANGIEPVTKKHVESRAEPSSSYSRHLGTYSTGSVEQLEEKDLVKKDSQLYLETSNSKAMKGRDLKEKNAKSWSSNEIISDSRSSIETTADSVFSRNMDDCNEDCSPREKEFLVRMKDPQLRESLQNIIRRRRSSVRFIPPRTDCRRKANETDDALLKKQPLASFHEDLLNSESVFTGTDNESQRAPSAFIPRTAARSTSEHAPEVQSIAGTVTSESCRVEDGGSLTRAANVRKLRHRNSQRTSVSRGNSFNRLSRPHGAASLCVKMKSDGVVTEETRIIRPATAKSSASRRLRQKSSQFQVPDRSIENYQLTSEEKTTIRETQMIREFLFIYAKVKNNPETYQEAERVRMMSETPEFVIKSAIGQFLTRTFPSAAHTLSNSSGRSEEDRKEDVQRMRLLRIKTCMEHLASVA